MSKLDELLAELCPNGVEFRRVDEICDISRGKVMSKDFIQANEGEYPVYSSQTENDGELGRISSYAYNGEYLTWTTDGANAGSIFYRKGKFSITNVCGLLKVNTDDVITRFIFHTLQVEAPKYVNKGMGNPKLMSNVMARIKFAVPPLEVQREIVRILDNFTGLTAELTAELTARKKQYEYYRNELLTFDISIPFVQLSELCDIGDGLHGTPKYNDDGEYYFINGNNLSNGRIVFDSKTKRISNDEYERIKIPFGETLLYSINGTIGNIALYNNENIVLGKSAAYFTITSDKLLLKYLFYILQSKQTMSYFEKNLTGSTIKNLGLKTLRDYKIALPSLDVQKRLVNVLDNFDAICSDLNIGLPAEIEARKKQYEFYRDKLLSFKQL